MCSNFEIEEIQKIVCMYFEILFCKIFFKLSS